MKTHLDAEKGHVHRLKTEICVVGGGLAGMCAAIAAARAGREVVLIHDRPMPGGNASSEVRMWPMGAHGKNRRETGLFEELLLENMYRNPTRNWPLWDSVMFEAVRFQKGITSLFNCSVTDAVMAREGRIASVSAWQMTTYRRFTVEAELFIDCSGDSILAVPSGARFRMGREAREEFGESIAPETGDAKTMGNSCLLQLRETPNKVPYSPPAWARSLPDESLLETRPHRPDQFVDNNFWWLELGGEQDTIEDAEEIRDELLKLAFGVWDHIKNRGDHGAETWDLDWAGFLPGKRESRRYEGDHILTQGDVQSGGHFEDIVAYGGWPIDDHPPAGFEAVGHPNVNHYSPSPFGIPYGCLYSANVENLMFAGRNISVTHAAMASSRVMGTCAILGQAAGIAASLALEKGVLPRGVNQFMPELQERIMEEDLWLPRHKRSISPLCTEADLETEAEDKENLRNGIDRPTDEEGDNGCFLPLGKSVCYTLKEESFVREVRLIFDSDLNRETIRGGVEELHFEPTMCNRPCSMEPYEFPTTMTRAFELRVDGKVIFRTEDNHQRLVRIPVNRTAKKLELIPLATFGDERAHVFSFDFK